MKELRHATIDWAGKQGYGVAIVDPAVVDAAVAENAARHRRGEIADALFQTYLSSHPDSLRAAKPWVSAVLVFSMPSPAQQVTFRTKGRAFKATIPPTYADDAPPKAGLAERLAAPSGPLQGWRVEPVRIPLKNVATRTGLVTYGRNNVTYSGKLGSYHRLVAVATDADLGGAAQAGQVALSVEPARTLAPECEGCGVCLAVCPTGAINEDRFVVHAERCLTFHNEKTDPWEPWLKPAFHNCLVGCMVCQDGCPRNAGALSFLESPAEFSEEETECLLASAGRGIPAGDPVWNRVVAKIQQIGLGGYESVLGRNLAALLQAGK